MPLEHSGSDEARDRNIAELVESYKATGKIGNVRPRSLDHARKVAAAVAYETQREAGKKD